MSFTSDMAKWCNKTAPEIVAKVIRTTVIEIGNRVVLRSPVGDATYWQHPPPPGYVGGRFRGNWQHGFNTIPDTITDTGRIDASGSTTINHIIGRVMASPAAGITYIVNNLPYAERIENGWSRQAPQGIVGLTELEFPEIFRRASA